MSFSVELVCVCVWDITHEMHYTCTHTNHIISAHAGMLDKSVR